ncbi:MAG: hypothetical protein ACR2L8_12915 [Solirubrobacteraceae bacterium]
MRRTAVLWTALGFVAGFGFLTLFVLFSEGPDVLVALSFVVLGMLAFGVIGALTTPPDER